jgi:hypothetical protein
MAPIQKYWNGAAWIAVTAMTIYTAVGGGGINDCCKFLSTMKVRKIISIDSATYSIITKI